MKKLYIRFALTMFFTVAVSSFVASLLSLLISHFFFAELMKNKIALFLRIRDMLMPLLTVISSVFLVSFFSKKSAAPIVALSLATKEIAKGDFNVSITPSSRLDEFGELERNFNLMVQELRSNAIMKKDFINNVSHEFKTPLAIIQGYSKLLADENITAQERHLFAEKIATESQRLITLTANILRLAKLESQAITAFSAPFLLDEQIRQAVLALQPAWSSRKISFDVDLLPLEYSGEEELLAQVWHNLIDNAIKFSEDGGIIRIKLEKLPDYIQIKITDYGSGISLAEQKHIFEQFYQADTSLAKAGSGLGLPIVKRIVSLHQGKVELASSPGEGSCFCVSLPL